MNTFQHLLAAKKLISCLLLLAFLTSTLAQNAPPKAQVREVTDEYFGQKIVDPYRWMENLEATETVQWMKAQNAYTRTYLDSLPLRAELVKRIDELSYARTIVGGIRRVGNQYFYFRRAPGEDSLKLYMRETSSGEERLLIDPEKLSSDGKNYSIEEINPSQDGRYVAYSITESGFDDIAIRVVETSTGKDMGINIELADPEP